MTFNIFDTNNTLSNLKEEANKNPTDVRPYIEYLNYKTAWRKGELQRSWKGKDFFSYVFIKKLSKSQTSIHIQFIKGKIKSGKNHIFYVNFDIHSNEVMEPINSSIIETQKRNVKAIMNMLTKGDFSFDQCYNIITKRFKDRETDDLGSCTVYTKVSGVIYEDLEYLSDISDKVLYDITGKGFHLISVDGSTVDIEVGDTSTNVYTIQNRSDSQKLLNFYNQNKKLVEKLTPSELLKILTKLGIRFKAKGSIIN